MDAQPIDAARLNRRITIQQQSAAQDAVGQQVQTWTTLYSCWAAIDVQDSQLLYETAEFISQTAMRITIRYTSSHVFNDSHRIVHTETTTGVVHTYQIKGVINPRQANVSLIFFCYELDEQE